ncbi:MAG TPA: hypothetical protein VL120_11210 [Solirubrobacteraceae bacterium]|jgi:hypothetical protein|nr:hypothetical protein [Solirubrobacteraceae bacterium]
MPPSTDSAFLSAETVVLAVLLVGMVLVFVLRRLRRTRPAFDVARPLLVGTVIRFLAIAGVAATGLQETLRGGDETTFLLAAQRLADSPFGHGFLPHAEYQLHTVIFGLELKYGGFSMAAMRVVQVGLAMVGVLLILAAVHDLSGPRAARIAAWVLAFEPGSIFFNSALHKEPLMMLASGLVVFGGTKLWRRLDLSGIAIAAVGGLIAVETRSYAGWFLVSGTVLLLLHASLRRLDRPLRAMPLIYGVVIVGFIAAPVIIQASSTENLKKLQISQDASSHGVKTGAQGGNNLALESVNYSARGAVVTNLPKRMYDVVARPYPWQVANPSQQLGAVGTLVALTGLVLLVRAAWRRRGEVLALTAPILYPMLFLLMAYALSAGNAGTGFRYRTHLVTLGFAMVFLLREYVPATARGASLAALGAPGHTPRTPAGTPGRQGMTPQHTRSSA